MTQSDFDFIDQLVENRLPDPPVRLLASALFASWYSVVLAGAVLAGAVIGFTA